MNQTWFPWFPWVYLGVELTICPLVEYQVYSRSLGGGLSPIFVSFLILILGVEMIPTFTKICLFKWIGGRTITLNSKIMIDPTSYDRPCWAFKALSSIRNSPFLWDGNKNTMLSFPAAERRVSLIVLKLRLGW